MVASAVFLGILTIKICWACNLGRQETETSMGGEKSGSVQLEDHDEDGRRILKYVHEISSCKCELC
jgi:hypothetical protein